MLKRPLERPHKNWRKENGEKNASEFKISKKGGKLNCEKCGKLGHNVRTYRGWVEIIDWMQLMLQGPVDAKFCPGYCVYF